MIILLCWCSCDELATEAVLKSLQLYVGLCGEVGLSTPRDAIVIALCKASLPPQYALHVLTVSTDVKGLLLDFYCFFFCESLCGSFQCSDSLILLAGRQGGHSAWKNLASAIPRDGLDLTIITVIHGKPSIFGGILSTFIPPFRSWMSVFHFSLCHFFTDLGAFFRVQRGCSFKARMHRTAFVSWAVSDLLGDLTMLPRFF